MFRFSDWSTEMGDRDTGNRNGKFNMLVVMLAALVLVIMVATTIWIGQATRDSMDEAVRTVSLAYLEELAGRREQVVVTNLNDKIDDLQTGINLMSQEDLSDPEHLQAYQARMKQLFNLERFAFVDTNGLIYTSTGTAGNIDEYAFDYKTITGPEISLFAHGDTGMSAIIAVPIDPISFNGEKLKMCFMQISMDVLLNGLSLQSDSSENTFCNIYTQDGHALTDMVLGGLAAEDNLLDALKIADFSWGYSYDSVVKDFETLSEGVAIFTYGGVSETLYYKPIAGTNWMLTYLVRESVITDRLSSVYGKIIQRNIVQLVLTAGAMLAMFLLIFRQMRLNAKERLDRETAAATLKAQQEDLKQKLELQNQLVEEQQKQAEQNKMITALASDYRSVYYVDLDRDEATVYRADQGSSNKFAEGKHFTFSKEFKEYAEKYVDEEYREDFLNYIDPESIRGSLDHNRIITFRYLTRKGGVESYEMLRMAGVRTPENRHDDSMHAVGVGFTDVDEEMRADMAKNHALSDALSVAEEASKAKTAFLSSMSHEIRTPMNAIIGLDNIALNDPDISDQTRGYLEKIGSSAQHLLNIINDILDMSRIESGRMTLRNEEFSMSELLEQVNTIISGQCSDKGIEYTCRINGSLDDYYIGDAMKLKQVIINILGNSVKFTSEGEVEFTLERTARFDGKTTIQMKMRDTGIGMSKEYLPHIFDAFSQEDSSSSSKYGSSGLGLAITKSIVEMMNGDIEVESEKGKGTTFTIHVTLADSANVSDAGHDINPQEMTVLIVDDDPIACEHARLVLERAGIASELAGSGEEAIDMVRVRHARREPYNLILVDWKMPGMDGVEATRRIRDIVGNESAIIILTAYKWDDVLEEALAAGVDSFLAKPLFAQNVIDEFKTALRKKGITAGEKGKADLKGRRILMAEDVAVNAEILEMILLMREMLVDHAVNGREAVELFSEHPEGYYDAILMDMRMPEMDGLTATAVIREMDRPDAAVIPIIALTANAFDEDVQRSLQAGLNAHLSKPVQPDVLFETLESLIPE